MIRSILIIDDEPSDRLIAERIIRKVEPDVTIFECSNGEQALELIRDKHRFEERCGPFPPPTLLLVDINMPRMGGFELLENIKQLTEDEKVDTSSMIVVMFTSSSSPMDKQRASEFDCVRHFVVKPLTVSAFRHLLMNYFKDSTAVDQGAA